MTDKQFSKGEVIFKEGEMGECLYQIKEGTVGIYASYGEDDEQLLAELNQNEIFGEMAVIEVYPRSATAVALSDIKAVQIEGSEVFNYFKEDPDRIIDIMKTIGNRLSKLTGDYIYVNSIIDELRAKDGDTKSDGLLDKIKKYASVYKKNKNADKLSAETIRKIEQSGHAAGYTVKVESYPRDTVLFKEGERGDCMYDIHTGSVGIYKAYGTPDEKLLTKLMPNQFFGELGMIEADKRSGTAVTLEDDTTIEVIYSKDLKELFKENPSKVEMILAHLSYRLRRLTKDYMKACGILYKTYEADQSGNAIGDDLKGEIKGYSGSLYD